MSSILCVGDFGTGEIGQYEVSKLIKYLINKKNIILILGLGDNIYPDGVYSENDSQFKEKFEKPYESLPKHIRFYNVLGNHDYHVKCSPRSQINYSKINSQWVLPHNFYCFKKKINKIPVEFFAIDTNLTKMKNRKTQEAWLINSLYESKARWRIVFGHHPWKSFGSHGNCSDVLDELYEKINRTNKVDLIISGHDHEQQHIYIPNKPNMIISGVGAKTHHNNPIMIYNELKYRSSKLGCCMIDFTKNFLKISFYNTTKEKEYTCIVSKN